MSEVAGGGKRERERRRGGGETLRGGCHSQGEDRVVEKRQNGTNNAQTLV